MTGHKILQKKSMAIILSIALAFLGIFSLTSIAKLQGNARVINYTGVVRGATQKLVKEELNGTPDDKLISRLDGIIVELQTGKGEHGLIRLNDKNFQDLMAKMNVEWENIKKEIAAVRQGADGEQLFLMSQDYFEIADQTVSEAEYYTENNARLAKIGFIVFAVIFIFVAGFLMLLSSLQSKKQKELHKAEEENREKKEYLSRLATSLQASMNDISELIYVADMDNYDLLFINEAGKKTFHLDDITGLKCYRALQGQEAPCPYCPNLLLKPGENYNWEITNPLSHRHYLLKDRLIEWEGRRARMEIAFDMTRVEEEKQKLMYALNVENMVMEGIRVLYQGRNLTRDIGHVLEQIGNFLQAERTYVFSVRDGAIYNDFEWCAQDVESVKDDLQGVSLSVFNRWLPFFERQECMVIEDVEEIKENFPMEYEALKQQGIRSLVVAPMERDGVLSGCLGVDNPPIEKLWNITSPLQTLCYFMLLTYKRAENERQLSMLSYHDTLTSFYNRNRFMEDLKKLKKEHISVGIIYLDVNGLKEINDKFGHAQGDELLVRAAGKMRSVFGQWDCYRVGGDEFVIICAGISENIFEERTAELRVSFEYDSKCHAAIGSQWADQTRDLDKVVSNADAMMYEDKKEFYRKSRKVNRYRQHSDEVLQLAEPQVLKTVLENGQFEVYLQPKILAFDRTAAGAEALVRYRSKNGNLILPENFLSILEEAKTIGQIDFYVFELMCSTMKKWKEQGKKILPVSVNFSRYTLMQPSFPVAMKEICGKYGISPALMEIEITESAGDVTGEDISRLIVCLRREGFPVAVDDFGTEYANLALLTAVEFDILKLDKAMVMDVAENHKTQAIIQSIAGICKKNGIRVVAEGVEDEKQLKALVACDVELIQGYLFSKPVSIRQYEEQYLQK